MNDLQFLKWSDVLTHLQHRPLTPLTESPSSNNVNGMLLSSPLNLHKSQIPPISISNSDLGTSPRIPATKSISSSRVSLLHMNQSGPPATQMYSPDSQLGLSRLDPESATASPITPIEKPLVNSPSSKSRLDWSIRKRSTSKTSIVVDIDSSNVKQDKPTIYTNGVSSSKVGETFPTIPPLHVQISSASTPTMPLISPMNAVASPSGQSSALSINGKPLTRNDLLAIKEEYVALQVLVHKSREGDEGLAKEKMDRYKELKEMIRGELQ